MLSFQLSSNLGLAPSSPNSDRTPQGAQLPGVSRTLHVTTSVPSQHCRHPYISPNKDTSSQPLPPLKGKELKQQNHYCLNNKEPTNKTKKAWLRGLGRRGKWAQHSGQKLVCEEKCK